MVLVYKPNAIILFGPSGAGKTTISNLLEGYSIFSVLHIGEILKEMSEKNELDSRDTVALDTGEPVSLKAIRDAIKRSVSKLHSPNVRQNAIWVIDGPPRDINQAKLIRHKYNIVRVFYFKISDDVLLQRLLHRYNELSRRDDQYQYVLHKIGHFRRLEGLMLAILGETVATILDANLPPRETATIIYSECLTEVKKLDQTR